MDNMLAGSHVFEDEVRGDEREDSFHIASEERVTVTQAQLTRRVGIRHGRRIRDAGLTLAE